MIMGGSIEILARGRIETTQKIFEKTWVWKGSCYFPIFVHVLILKFAGRYMQKITTKSVSDHIRKTVTNIFESKRGSKQVSNLY